MLPAHQQGNLNSLETEVTNQWSSDGIKKGAIHTKRA